MIALALALVVPPVAIFQDWIWGCDNAGSCQAIALLPDAPDSLAGSIAIWSPWSGDDGYKVQLSLLGPTDSNREFSLHLNGQDSGATFDQNGMLQAGDPVALIRRIARAQRIDVVGGDGTAYQVSLRGVRAALGGIDRVQQRDSTNESLIAPGTLRRGSIENIELPTIRVPLLSREPPPSISKKKLSRIGAAWSCDLPPPSSVIVRRLDLESSVVAIPCSKSAYQSDYLIYISDNQGVMVPAIFESRTAKNVLIEANVVGMSIEANSKGRGLGDCGEKEKYVWDGKAFRAIFRSEMPVCRGSLIPIVTWRARAEPRQGARRVSEHRCNVTVQIRGNKHQALFATPHSMSRRIATLDPLRSVLHVVAARDDWFEVEQATDPATGEPILGAHGWIHKSHVVIDIANGRFWMRARPNESGARVGQVKAEESLDVVDCFADWLRVRRGTLLGWIAADAQCSNPLTTCT